MKKLLMVSTLVAGLLLVGCGKTAAPEKAETATKTTATAAAAPALDGKVIFEKADLKGDDNGPGTYTYPTDRVFSAGAFDLTGFKILDAGSSYNFVFETAIDFKNDWKNAGGWDVQMFDIYMNLGTGKFKHTVSGRHVKVAEGWDIAMVVGPDKATRMSKEIADKNEDVFDDVTPTENIAKSVLIPDAVTVKGNMLIASIAKDKVGDLSKLNGVQAFVLGSEGYPNKEDTYNRVVNEFSAQWRIGGGSDYFGDPNVMDIIGENKALGNYKSDEGVSEFATINLVK